MSPKDAHILEARTCEYVTSHGKRDPADVSKDLEMGKWPWFTRRTQHYHQGPYKRNEGWSHS